MKPLQSLTDRGQGGGDNGKESPAWLKPLHTGVEKATQGLTDLTELQACVSAVNSAHPVTAGTNSTHSMTGDKLSITLCFRDLELAKELSALPSASWGQVFPCSAGLAGEQQ